MWYKVYQVFRVMKIIFLHVFILFLTLLFLFLSLFALIFVVVVVAVAIDCLLLNENGKSFSMQLTLPLFHGLFHSKPPLTTLPCMRTHLLLLLLL